MINLPAMRTGREWQSSQCRDCLSGFLWTGKYSHQSPWWFLTHRCMVRQSSPPAGIPLSTPWSKYHTRPGRSSHLPGGPPSHSSRRSGADLLGFPPRWVAAQSNPKTDTPEGQRGRWRRLKLLVSTACFQCVVWTGRSHFPMWCSANQSQKFYFSFAYSWSASKQRIFTIFRL